MPNPKENTSTDEPTKPATARFFELANKALEHDKSYWTLVALVTIASAVAVLTRYPFNHDLANTLDYVQRMMEGEVLYRDIIDPNPPLIFYLTAIPVALSRLTGVSDMALLNLFNLFFVFLPIFLVSHLLKLGKLYETVGERRSLVFVLLALAVPYAAYDFGQRDHISLFLLLPYLVNVAYRTGGETNVGSKTLYVLIGLLAAVGIALKPYFIAAWLFPEAYLYWRTKNWKDWLRLDNFVIVGFGVAYLAWTFLATPYLENVGFAMETYGKYDSPLHIIYGASYPLLWQTALVATFFLRPGRNRDEHHLRIIVALAFAAFFYSAFVQTKGWTYHWLPARTTAWLLIALALTSAVERTSSWDRLFRVPAKLIPILLTIVALSATAWGTYAAVNRLDGRSAFTIEVLTEVTERLAYDDQVAWLSTDLYPAFPTIRNAGALSVLHFNALWTLPGQYSEHSNHVDPFPYHAYENMSKTERHLVDSVVGDIIETNPSVIVVDARPKKQGFGDTTFDHLAYFLTIPKFAELFEQYKFAGKYGPIHFYQRQRETEE